MPSKNQLHSLEPAEVSVVGRPANRKKVLLFKSADGAMPQDVRDVITSLTPEQLERIQKRFKQPVQKDAEGPDSEQLNGLSERAQQAITACARILAPFKDEVASSDISVMLEEIGIEGNSDDDEGDDAGLEDADDVGDDSDADDDAGDEDAAAVTPVAMSADNKEADQGQGDIMGDSKTIGKVGMEMKAPDGVDAEHHAAAMSDAKDAYMAGLKKKGYQTKSENPFADKDKDDKEKADKKAKVEKDECMDDKEEVKKSADFLSLEQKYKQLVQKSESDAARIKEIEDRESMKTYVAKCESLTHLTGDKTEFARVMKSYADRNDSAGMEHYERVLKSLNEQAKAAQSFGGSLFATHGSMQGDATGGDAEAKLEAMARAYVAKGEEKLSYEQSYDRILKSAEGRALYAEAQKAKGR